jgi:hypothetical protein
LAPAWLGRANAASMGPPPLRRLPAYEAKTAPAAPVQKVANAFPAHPGQASYLCRPDPRAVEDEGLEGCHDTLLFRHLQTHSILGSRATHVKAHGHLRKNSHRFSSNGRGQYPGESSQPDLCPLPWRHGYGVGGSRYRHVDVAVRSFGLQAGGLPTRGRDDSWQSSGRGRVCPLPGCGTRMRWHQLRRLELLRPGRSGGWSGQAPRGSALADIL